MKTENTKRKRLKILLIIFIPPIVMTLLASSSVSLVFSPLDGGFEKLENHFIKNSWIFSVLNLGRDIPYYNIAPYTRDLSPAATTTYKNVKNAIESLVSPKNISYDSLTCFQNKLKGVDQEKALSLSDINWTNCKFFVNLNLKGSAIAISTAEQNPKLAITMGYIGLIIIFSTSFALWNGVIILFTSAYHGLFRLFNKQT